MKDASCIITTPQTTRLPTQKLQHQAPDAVLSNVWNTFCDLIISGPSGDRRVGDWRCSHTGNSVFRSTKLYLHLKLRQDLILPTAYGWAGSTRYRQTGPTGFWWRLPQCSLVLGPRVESGSLGETGLRWQWRCSYQIPEKRWDLTQARLAPKQTTLYKT